MAKGSYYIRFGTGWLPREAVVEAGKSEISIRRAEDDSFLLQPKAKLGIGGAALVKSDLKKCAGDSNIPRDCSHDSSCIAINDSTARATGSSFDELGR